LPAPTPSSTDLPLAPGASVGRYKVIRPLGEGGMGEVYLARDTQLGRKVALKWVRGEAMASPQARERFLFEARTTARFNHPHIVTVYDVGEHAGRPYVALEYLDGETLRERLDRQRPAPREAIRALLAIAEALREAHAHQIVHRDLKPGNVMVGQDGRVRVLDFGLAQAGAEPGVGPGAADAEGEDRPAFVSDGGGLRGTPAYMAPEQWRGEAVGPPADLWAFGILAVELLQGRHPFAGLGFAELRERARGPGPAPVLALDPDIPAEVRDVVARCLRPAPADRPEAAMLVETLAGCLHGDGPVRSAEAPFRGLLPFEERHGAAFFGRDAEIAAFVERLRSEAILPVVGPSGAGKSSFVLAGVVPRLREQGPWRVIRLRPGAEPFRALAARLAPDAASTISASSPAATGTEATVATPGPSPAPGTEVTLAVTGPPAAPAPAAARPGGGAPASPTFQAELRAAPGRLGLHLAALAEAERARVLLLVDQLEELYTLGADEAERQAFMEALSLAADDPEGPVRVVLTLRDDFLGRLAVGEAARRALSRVTVLRTPGPEALREILERPVRAAGFAYEDERLVTDMVADVAGEGAALALLQFAGQALWERRDVAGRRLTRAAYEAIGGVAGALARHADGVLAGLTPAQARQARELYLRLVTAQGTRRTVARRALLEGLAPEAAEVLDRLTEARTVLQRRSRSGEADDAELELVHESLIQTWDRLRRWVEESHEERALLAEIGQAAELWRRRGEREAEVWQGEALAEAAHGLARCTGPVPDVVRSFVAAGERRLARHVRRRRGLLAAAFLGLVALAVVLAAQNRQTRHERNRARLEHGRAEVQRTRAVSGLAQARTNWAEALREGAAAALSRQEFPEARARLRAALELADSPLARALWLSLRAQPLHLVQKGLEGSCPPRFVAGGTQVATCGESHRAVVVLDVDTRQVLRTLRGPRAPITALDAAPDGTRVAAGTRSGEIWLLSLADGSSSVLPGNGQAVRSVAFDPTGALLASGSQDRTVRVWEVTKRTLRTTLAGHTDGVQGVCFRPDGQVLASAGGLSDPTVRLWDVARGVALRTLAGHTSAVRALAYSPDGRLLASGSFDRTVRLWRPDGPPGEPRVLSGHTAAVIALAYSPDGRRLASGGNGDDVRLWDVASGRMERRLLGHDGAVTGVTFHPGRPLLATKGSTDLRIWDLAAAPPVEAERGAVDERLAAMRFSPDFRHLLLAGDRHLRLRDLTSLRDRDLPAGHTDLIIASQFSDDGQRLATASLDRTVRLWDVATGAVQRILVGPPAFELYANRAGTLLASHSQMGQRVNLWPLPAGERRQLVGHRAPVRTLDFSRDGRRIATGSYDQSVRVFRADSGALERELAGQGSWVLDVVFDPAGSRLASAGRGGEVVLWDVATGRALRRLKVATTPVWQVLFAPDGRRLATRTETEVRLWDAATGEGRGLETVPHEQRLPDAAWHPSRPWLAVARSDGAVHVQRLDGGGDTWIRGHRTAVLSVTWSADGQRLGTIDEAGVARLWEAATGRAVWRAPLLDARRGALCTHAGWTRVGEGTVAAPAAAEPAWRRAVAERATQADLDPTGAGVCLLDDQGLVERWDTAADRRDVQVAVPGAREVVALASACLVLERGGDVRRVDRAGVGPPLATAAGAIGRVDGEILVAAGGVVRRLDGALHEVGRTPVSGTVTAVTRVGDHLVVGRAGGQVERLRVDGRPEPAPPTFQTGSAAAVTRLLPGPARTLAAGHDDGHVALLGADTGERLSHLRLQGAIVHLARVGQGLVVASAVGEHRVIPLQAFDLTYCELLDQVWSTVPATWAEGRPRRRAPPAAHACRRRRTP
jgi:WD40 repeat protein